MVEGVTGVANTVIFGLKKLMLEIKKMVENVTGVANAVIFGLQKLIF